MNIQELRRALIAFADDASDLDLTRGELIVQIRDELIEAAVEESDDGDRTLYVIENGERTKARHWLVDRIARIPLLAERIVTHIGSERHFVTPSGRLLNYLDEDPDESEVDVEDVPGRLPNLLSGQVGTSSVLYVTSEAGEGKTTLINELARVQARKYRAKRAHWLLVPISLGGRAFMTFDDIVVAELVNKLRFHLFHYDAFLEMVRLGVLVPAFDGFEEMFVAGSSGEALSALGNLIADLHSSGSVLVAARIAYFHYRNFKTQARLFDAIKEGSVNFAQLHLNRWTRSQFLNYAEKRGLPNGEVVHDKIRTSLGQENHPVLTRAVLVARLLDEAENDGLDNLIARLHADRNDYFHQFVCAIVEREAKEKWIDQSTPHQPLLSPTEHHILLSEVANDMWMTSTDALRGDYLDLVADLFTEERRKPPQIKRQIMQRVRQHALISKAVGSNIYTFDHDDFRRYYFGFALGRLIVGADTNSLIAFLGKAELAPIAIESALNAVKRDGIDLIGVLPLFESLSALAASASYAGDNVGALVMRTLEIVSSAHPIVIKSVTFPPNAFKARKLGHVVFEDCQFQSTSLRSSSLGSCGFTNCTLHQLELPDGFDASRAVIDRCEVNRIMTSAGYLYDPAEINNALSVMGFDVKGVHHTVEEVTRVVEPDEETKIAVRTLRIFMRTTQINANVLRQKFGNRSGILFQSVLPKMLEAGVLETVQFKGSGMQQRYKLCIPMTKIDMAVPVPHNVESIEEFLEAIVGTKSVASPLTSTN